MRKIKLIQALVPALMFLVLRNGLAYDVLPLGFSNSNPAEEMPEHWEKLKFPKIKRQTVYSLIHENDKMVIQAVSHASASGLIRNISVSPERYPWISWHWKIDHVLKKGDVSTKQGDDYAARIYVAFEYSPAGKNLWQRMRYRAANFASGGKLPGSALNYIWANKAPKAMVVRNAYSDETKMIVVQSGDSSAGRWVAEKRNLVDDYLSAFGQPPPPIMGIAIMTDTDNTGESTTAYYRDIRLSDE